MRKFSRHVEAIFIKTVRVSTTAHRYPSTCESSHDNFNEEAYVLVPNYLSAARSESINQRLLCYFTLQCHQVEVELRETNEHECKADIVLRPWQNFGSIYTRYLKMHNNTRHVQRMYSRAVKRFRNTGACINCAVDL
jgi:hypothetical protein